MNKIMQRMKGLKRAIVLAGLILAGLAPAWAQDLYVIHNGNNYLSHNATTGARSTQPPAFGRFQVTICVLSIVVGPF